MVEYNDFVNRVGVSVVTKYGEDALKLLLIDARKQCLDFIHSKRVRAFDEANLSDFENDRLDEATIEQAKYLIANGGDIGNMSGFDPVNNSFISRDEIEKRVLSARAEQALRRTKYFARGLW